MPLLVDQATIDSIVDSAYKGEKIDVDVKKIADEYEIEGGSMTWAVEFIVLDPEYLSDYLADEEMLVPLGLSDVADLTDELRLNHALHVIEGLLRWGEGDHACVCAIEICDSRKRKALISFELAGGYMLAFPPVTTIGIFLDEKRIRKVYKDRGYITEKDSPEWVKDQLRKFFSWN
jgi:hypothetical protein